MTTGSVALAALLAVSGCQQTPASAAADRAGPVLDVSVLTIETEPVTLSRELPGRTSAFRVAEVRARVSGIVQKRCFTEGADVAAGELLFEIDPAPYQAALDIARAALARAEAGLANARVQEERCEALVATRAIAKQTYDDAVAARLILEADTAAGRAAVRAAEINLGYTSVTSPIAGRIGRAEVTEGAYVQQATATLLATIQQLDPLYVDLNQSAADLLELKQALDSGRLRSTADGGAVLTLVLDNGQAYPLAGSLQFSGVTVNTGTGTVALRGTVPNPDLDLLPGLFVRARLDEGTDPGAILLSQALVSRNTKGEATTMVVGAGDTVELRVLQTSRTIGNRWLITAGLQAGDRVITDNLQKIRPGMPVRPGGAPPAAETNNPDPARQPAG